MERLSVGRDNGIVYQQTCVQFVYLQFPFLFFAYPCFGDFDDLQIFI